MRPLLFALCTLGLSCSYRPVGNINTATYQEQNKLFAPAELVEVQLESGSCLIQTGPKDAIHVRVVHRYGPAEKFEAKFYEGENLLRMEEDFHSLARGQTEWTLEVPPQTRLRVKTTSGDVVFSGLVGEVEIQTISGDIHLKDSRGDFALQTDSGSISATAFRPDAPCFFTSASGNLTIGLAQAPAHDLTLTTASGDARLLYNSAPLRGSFAFYARVDQGEIAAPFAFDHEQQITLDGQPYWLKSFSREGDAPKIVLRTASGRVELRP